MIGKLNGTIDLIYLNQLFVNVHDVSFRVLVPTKLLQGELALGSSIELFIHTYVREDLIQLFGFSSSEELFLFEKMLSVSGIGGKLALSIISSGSVEEVVSAVVNADVEFFTAISGIGKKSAQRIIVELKPAFGEKRELDLVEAHLPKFQETYDALKHFGFTKEEARDAVREVKNAKDLTSEELIKSSLKVLAK